MNHQRLKYKIKEMIPKFIIEILAYSGIVRNLTGIGYFGLTKLDKQIVPFLPKRNGYYVELGANDGVRQSNTLHFEKYKNFSGVLIEPIPQKFEECKKNRSIRNYFSNSACVSFEYKKPTMKLLYSNLMTTSLEGDSDIADRAKHAKSGEHLIKEKLYKFEINAKTLNDILIEAGSPHVIDLLSLDVEGSEIEVLKGIDFEKFTFKIICIESRDLEKIQTLLLAKGYILLKKISFHDYLFKKLLT